MFKRLRNMERINGYSRKVSSFLPPHPPPDVVCEEKQVGCNTDHISLANHHLKSRHISHEQRLQVRKKQSCKIHFISRLVKRRYYNVNVNACLSVCLSVRPQYSSTFCDSPKVMKKKNKKKQVNAFYEKNIFCYYATEAVPTRYQFWICSIRS